MIMLSLYQMNSKYLTNQLKKNELSWWYIAQKLNHLNRNESIETVDYVKAMVCLEKSQPRRRSMF